MKKIIMIFTILCLFGCEKENPNQKRYQNWVKELQNNIKEEEKLPFDVNANLEKFVEEEYRYHIIIDNPKEEIHNIKALVVHDQKTTDIFPSIGIFDDEVSLIPNKIEENQNQVKGIALIGYVENFQFPITLKVKIQYEQSGKLKTAYKTFSFDK